jgi:hypothetical protein
MQTQPKLKENYAVSEKAFTFKRNPLRAPQYSARSRAQRCTFNACPADAMARQVQGQPEHTHTHIHTHIHTHTYTRTLCLHLWWKGCLQIFVVYV